LIVAPTVLISSLIIIFGRNWLFKQIHFDSDTNEVINGYFSVIGTLYGILLGLVAISTWENFGYVETIASKESTAIVQLYRNAGLLDEPIRSQLHKDIEDYLNYVIYVAWPAHKNGKVPEQGTLILTHFHLLLSTYHPRNKEQEIFLAQVLSSFNNVIEERRTRMHYVLDSGQSPIIWFFIIIGGVLTLSCGFLFHLPTLKVHLFINLLLSLLLSFTIFLMVTIDQPFRGELSVTPKTYSNTLSVLHLLKTDRHKK
jgi:hypothetical protein